MTQSELFSELSVFLKNISERCRQEEQNQQVKSEPASYAEQHPLQGDSEKGEALNQPAPVVENVSETRLREVMMALPKETVKDILKKLDVPCFSKIPKERYDEVYEEVLACHTITANQ